MVTNLPHNPIEGGNGNASGSEPIRLIYIVTNDEEQVKDLESQITNFGYSFLRITTLDELREALTQISPVAILVDRNSSNVDEQIFPKIRGSLGIVEQNIPFIIFADDEQFQSRLNAVRAGGNAYFQRPIDAGQLVETLDRLTSQDVVTTDPFRVLILDDSPLQARFVASHLVKVGIKAVTLHNPREILDQLPEFNPDLLILDMYMPDVNGKEIASMIRQIETYDSLPIVFLSAETDRDRQLEAMSLGGDDFLTKPIDPPHLISAVLSRAERYRKIKSMMVRDSLTRLLNATTFQDRFKQEMARSDRQVSQLSFAFLDIDHFKSVNDRFGHATGDRVLRNLANLLRQRLRRSDIIGRIGGEEFAIVMPDTGLEAACKVMEELCKRFSEIRHRTEEKTFTTTFSCGVSCSNQYKTPSELFQAADDAMYAAKSAGRNRVLPAG